MFKKKTSGKKKNEHLGSVNDVCCLSTCTMKFGWMDRKKRRGDLPCQRMESSIQRMPANFTVITQNCFRFDLPVAFSPGPQEYRWLSVLTVFCLLWKPAGLRVLRTRIGNDCCKHSLVLPKFSSWFPVTPLLQLQLAICCICCGPMILATQTCQYYHSISVCTLNEAKNGFK